MFATTSLRALPESVIELAFRIYADDPLHAVDRLVESLADNDLRQLAAIAIEAGPDAAEMFYRSRPRRLRVTVARPRSPYKL
jgi:hypothetical protein